MLLRRISASTGANDRCFATSIDRTWDRPCTNWFKRTERGEIRLEHRARVCQIVRFFLFAFFSFFQKTSFRLLFRCRRTKSNSIFDDDTSINVLISRFCLITGARGQWTMMRAMNCVSRASCVAVDIRITAAVSWSRLKVIRRSSLRQFRHPHRNFLFDAIIIVPVELIFSTLETAPTFVSSTRLESYFRVFLYSRSVNFPPPLPPTILLAPPIISFARNVPVCNDKNIGWDHYPFNSILVVTWSHDNVNYSVETMSAIIVATDWAMGGSRLISLHGKCTLSRVCTTQPVVYFIFKQHIFLGHTVKELRPGTVLRLCLVNEPTAIVVLLTPDQWQCECVRKRPARLQDSPSIRF